MISPERLIELMREAITEAKKSQPEDHGTHPYVGAVLADRDGNIVAQAHRGEAPGAHAEYLLLDKAGASGVEFGETTLFITLEPCTSRGAGKVPCAQRIIESGIPNIYIGQLDPNPQICGRGETRLRWDRTVERFPADLERTLQELNKAFLDAYRSAHLPNDSLYVKSQISDLVLQELTRAGCRLDTIPYDWETTATDLAKLVQASGQIDNVAAASRISAALGNAFDRKYGDYTYGKDSRGMSGHDWRGEILDILRMLKAHDYSRRRIIDVGVGNGLELDGLFDRCERLTMVDIAPRSLERAKARVPSAQANRAAAESLDAIPTGSQDIYVSFRTYQSSYFGISDATREAYRVVRQGGIVLISIANGFLADDAALIPGLVIPKTNVVDKDHAFESAEKVRRRLTLLGFEEPGVRTGVAEIFVYGRRGR